jgi:hypothetical protein
MADNHQLTNSFYKNEIRIDYTTLTPRFQLQIMIALIMVL